MRRTTFALLTLSASLLAAAAIAAPQAGLQLEIAGLGAVPLGTLEAQGGSDARDLFGTGPGGTFAAIVRYHRDLGAGMRVGYTHSAKEGEYAFEDASGLPFSGTPPPVPGPFDIRRSLFRIPVLAVVQYHVPLGSRVALRGEGGAGITTFTERVKLRSTSGELFTIAGYQQNFSYSLGLSLVSQWIPRVDLITGAVYEQAITDDGDVWRKSDNPKFVSGTVGIRFPRY